VPHGRVLEVAGPDPQDDRAAFVVAEVGGRVQRDALVGETDAAIVDPRLQQVHGG
jgi:hypothetical protein